MDIFLDSCPAIAFVTRLETIIWLSLGIDVSKAYFKLHMHSASGDRTCKQIVNTCVQELALMTRPIPLIVIVTSCGIKAYGMTCQTAVLRGFLVFEPISEFQIKCKKLIAAFMDIVSPDSRIIIIHSH